MRITRVYTRTGNQGETSLGGGKRVGKDSPRVQAYGEVDELNSVLGVVRAQLEDKEIDQVLNRLQAELFIVGADLANPLETNAPRIEKEHIVRLEQEIDHFTCELPPLREFILPGGKPEAAGLHVARAVARRAERAVVKLAREESINDQVISYLNRLSDLLFVLARVANRRAGVSEEEVAWNKRKINPQQEKEPGAPPA